MKTESANNPWSFRIALATIRGAGWLLRKFPGHRRYVLRDSKSPSTFRPRACDDRLGVHFGLMGGQMTDGTKGHPFGAGSLPAPEFNAVKNSDFFYVFILQPLVVGFCLFVFSALLFKSNIQTRILKLKRRYLLFRLRKSVSQKHNLRFENVRDGQIGDPLLDVVEHGHKADSCPLGLKSKSAEVGV